jgi:nicotinate-nucleotide adenylyltransferase
VRGRRRGHGDGGDALSGGRGVRLGLFGGTFDPPHVGHLLAATDAVERLSLDRLLLVPASVQPLKGASIRATPEQRLAMTALLAGDDPRLAVDPIEIDRTGLSFTVDTLAAVARREPDAERFLLVGADVLESFAQWREPARVLELATLVVLRRGEEPVRLPPSGREIVVLPTRRVDVSSTEIRERVRVGRSIRGFVPDAVAAYIGAAGLYR